MIIVSLQVLFYSELLKRRGVVCLIIVSTPGPGFVMIKARFGQVDDEVGHALFGKVMLYIDIVITAILYSMYINQQLTNSY